MAARRLELRRGHRAGSDQPSPAGHAGPAPLHANPSLPGVSEVSRCRERNLGRAGGEAVGKDYANQRSRLGCARLVHPGRGLHYPGLEHVERWACVSAIDPHFHGARILFNTFTVSESLGPHLPVPLDVLRAVS